MLRLGTSVTKLLAKGSKGLARRDADSSVRKPFIIPEFPDEICEFPNCLLFDNANGEFGEQPPILVQQN
jgi:hypothetical protein